MTPRARRRDALSWAALALITWALFEALCLGTLFALARWRGLEVPLAARFRLDPAPRSRLARILAGREPYYPFDAELGWTVRRSGRLPLYRANSQGIRADRDYAPEPPPGVLRIAAFGDSFVHGTEVANADTWPARLAGLRPDLEVLNFGVGGYGLDQAWLRYRRDGRPFHPHLAVIGLISEDAHRSVNRFRPFLAPRQLEPRAKPRFALREGELVLLPNPLPELDDYRELLEDEEAVLARVGRGDYFWENLWSPTPLSLLASARLLRFVRFAWSETRIAIDGRMNPRSEAFAVTARVIEAFHDDALGAGSLPVVAILPTRADFERRRAGRGDSWAALRERLAAAGIASVEVLDCFERPRWAGPLVFMKGGHYGPELNRGVARCLFEDFAARGWLSLASLPRAVAAARSARASGPGPPGSRIRSPAPPGARIR
jgi:hypothetical protein